MEQLNVKITTFDNPYNPFSDYQKWAEYDLEHGYMTNETFAALTGNTDDFLDNTEVLERESVAINYMLDEHPMNHIWRIVRREDSTPIG